MPEEQAFLGRGWGFPPTFQKNSGTVRMSSDVEDIEESLSILLSTSVGERVMQPKYGCDMDQLLFEPLDTTLQAYMEDLIRTAILYFESRILLDAVILEPDPHEGIIYINIHYTVAATNTRYNFVYPFYKEGGIDIPQRMIGPTGHGQ